MDFGLRFQEPQQCGRRGGKTMKRYWLHNSPCAVVGSRCDPFGRRGWLQVWKRAGVAIFPELTSRGTLIGGQDILNPPEYVPPLSIRTSQSDQPNRIIIGVKLGSAHGFGGGF